MAVPKRRTSHSPQGHAAQPPPRHADADPVLPAVQRAGPAAPRLPELRLLPGPRRRRRWKRQAREVTHADRPRRDGRRPRPGPDRGRRRPGRRRRPGPDASSSSATRPQLEPLLAAGRAAGERLEVVPLPPQVVDMEEKPVEALRKKPDNSIIRCWQLLAEQEGRRHRQRRQHRGDGRRRAADPQVPQGRPPARASPPCMPTAKGRVRHPRRRGQRPPQAAPPVPVRRHGRRSSPSTSSASSGPTIGLMNVGEEEGKGHDLAQETLRPVPQQPAEGPLRRQHRGPRHPPRRGRRGRHRRVRRQRGAEGHARACSSS